MKTQRELNQHYWGILHEMVGAYNKTHSADVKPWECVKWRNIYSSDNVFKTYVSDPIFTNRNDENIFAVAILFDEQAKEHKPVFPGDTVYEKLLPFEFTVVDANTLERDALKFKGLDWSKFTWHKPQPKRTFDINGVELPCPVKNENAPQRLFVWGETFYFDRVGDDAVWRDAIRSLLKEARDK